MGWLSTEPHEPSKLDSGLHTSTIVFRKQVNAHLTARLEWHRKTFTSSWAMQHAGAASQDKRSLQTKLAIETVYPARCVLTQSSRGVLIERKAVACRAARHPIAAEEHRHNSSHMLSTGFQH